MRGSWDTTLIFFFVDVRKGGGVSEADHRLGDRMRGWSDRISTFFLFFDRVARLDLLFFLVW